MINNLTFKIYEEINSELELKWKDFDKENTSHIFQNVNFLKEHTKNKKSKFYYVTISFEKKLCMIIPLEIKNFFGVRILQLIGTKEFDYCSPILTNLKNYLDDISFNKLWKKILHSIGKYDFILLDKQPEKVRDIDNPLVKYLKNTYLSKVYLIELPNSETEYLDKFHDKKFLNELLRTTKKLQKDYEVNFKILDDDKTLNLSKIVNNKARILNKKKIKHILDEKFLNYFIELKKRNKELFNISLLEINKEVVSANLGFIYQKTFYYYLPTIFSNKYSKFSPGKVLIFNLIGWCIKNNIKNFDFGIGNEDYKKYWSNKSVNIFRYTEYKSFKGLLFYFLLKIYIFLRKLKNK